ncbi:MAG: cytochrome c biogenesis protein CcdA, partial [Armatimonadota bacterium]
FSPNEEIPVYEGTIYIFAYGKVKESVRSDTKAEIKAILDIQGCTDTQCLMPQKIEIQSEVDIVKSSDGIKKTNSTLFQEIEKKEKVARSEKKDDDGLKKKLESASLPIKLGILYVFGIMLAFTPCVYPMYPITLGYFSNQSEKNTLKVLLYAAVYVFGIGITYSILGVFAALTGNQIGTAMQMPIIVVGISLMLFALSLSMFGLFEIKPPEFIAKRSAGKTGIIGAFFMGLIFGLVASPCVGPVVLGLMLYVAQIGDPLQGFLLFFVMAIGIGTPLFGVAAFSAKLPMPGLWMVTVKRIAGFLLMGAAVYFLTPIIPANLGRIMMPFVLLSLAFYLVFMDTATKSSKWSRGLVKVIAFILASTAIIYYQAHGFKESLTFEPYSENAFNQAIKDGKPVILKFSAKWCVSCKELEHGALSDPKVIKEGERFARFVVDGTSPTPEVKELEKKFKVAGYPTVFFYDKNGKEVQTSRVIGNVNKEIFLQVMKKVN